MVALPFTLRQLEIFELLCDLRSFRRTSEALGISQAAVSNQLKALERQMGVRLLTRESGRRPQLTPQGASFLADLAPFWRAADALAAHRRGKPAGTEQDLDLRVLIGNYLFKDSVRPKLDRFLERHPAIHLQFVTPTISDLPRDMAARDNFDFGMFQDQLIEAPLGEGMRELARIRCGVFGNRSLLKGRNGALSPAELSELPFILPPAGTPYENLILSMLARHGIKPLTIAGRTQYFDVMSAMFERGNSVGASLEPLVRPEHRNVALLFPLEDWRLVFYRRPGLSGPRIEAVEEFLISSVLGDPAYPRLPAHIAPPGD